MRCARRYVNAGNLGLPIAAYVLGDASLVVPVLLFQLLVATPTGLAVLDVTARRQPARAAAAAVRTAAQPDQRGLPLRSGGGRRRLAPAARGAPPVRPGRRRRRAAGPDRPRARAARQPPVRRRARKPGQRYLAVALKVAVQPAVAWAIGHFLFHLDGHALLAAVVLSALPSAQNLFVYATRYDRATGLARDAIVLSTLAAVPALVIIAALLT